jgi:hypothetical protein
LKPLDEEKKIEKLIVFETIFKKFDLRIVLLKYSKIR